MPADSPEALAVNVPPYAADFNADGTPPGYPVGYEVLYTPPGGVESHYVAILPGQLAAPGVTAGEWRQVTPAQPAQPLTATLSEAAFLILLADAALGPYVNKDLYLNQRPAGAGRVMVHVTGPGAFEPDGQLFDPANDNAPATPVTVSVVGGAVVTSPRGGFGGYVYKGVFPVGTPTAVKKNEVYTTAAGVPFEAKSDFTATAAPAAGAYWAPHAFVVQAQLAGKADLDQFRRGLRRTPSGFIDTTAVDYVGEVAVTLNDDIITFGASVGLAYRVDAEASTSTRAVTLATTDAAQNGRLVAVRNVSTTRAVQVLNPDPSVRDTLAPGDYAWYAYQHPGFETVARSSVRAPRDITDVSAAKRAAVVAANAPSVPESDAAAYAEKYFVDEVSVPGSTTLYQCKKVVQANGTTVCKWLRSVIE